MIAALFVNSYLGRRERRREAEHERLAIRSALRAELLIVRDTIRSRIQAIVEAKTDGSNGVLVPLESNTSAYDSLLGRVGLLEIEKIRASMTVYLLVKQMPERIRSLGRAAATQDEKELSMAFVGSKYFDQIEQLHRSHLDSVEEALVRLSD